MMAAAASSRVSSHQLRPRRATKETIAASVKKTNRVIIAHEDALSWGIGSEIAARIADEMFPWLDAPVKRVASLDTWVAYSPQLEDAILPQTEDVLSAIESIVRY